MQTVQDIKTAIKALPESEYKQLRNWITESDWNEWDMQIEKDVAIGKLDFLYKEAHDEKQKGTLKEL
jgi:hypothetical protein